MRKALAIAAAGLLALTACGTKEAGSSKPATDSPTSTVDSTPADAGPGGTATLGPDGKEVYIGDTVEKVTAAGWTITVPTNADYAAKCPFTAELKAEGSSVPAMLAVSAEDGVALIDAKGSMHTPEGIKIGSTTDDVKKAYPNVSVKPKNIITIPVPGNENAYYGITFDDTKVIALFVRLNDTPC